MVPTMNKSNDSHGSEQQLAALDMQKLLSRMKAASSVTALAPNLKSEILLKITDEITQHQPQIIAISLQDYAAAQEQNASSEILSRLKLDEAKLKSCIDGLKGLAAAEDPVGKVQLVRELDDGLVLQKKTYPIGIIAVIFEARPDVIIQVAGLAIKTGNFMILKPGKEASQTCSYLMALIHRVLLRFNVPLELLCLVHSRTDVAKLLAMDEYIDLIIPRGSKSLVQYIEQNTRIPVMGHADGICHIYADYALTDFKKAIRVIIDSKTQYPAACNAVETVLIHRSIDPVFIEELVRALQEHHVLIQADAEISRITGEDFPVPASWQQEFGSLQLSLHLIDGLDQAVQHINCNGSQHTDCILTDNSMRAMQFMQQVDSANVFHNCSTRFADGYRYGFGAEVGISTHKILERGPVGLEGLMTYKYHVAGDSHIVADYSGVDAKPYTHKTLISA